MSRWKKISLAVLLFVVVLIGALGFLVGTTTGLHVLFNAANRWVPGLDITSVEGGWRNLTIKGLRYEQPGVSVNAGEINLAMKLSCLRDSSICVNNFALKDIDVVVDHKKMPPSAPVQEEDSGPLDLSTPYPITLSRVALNNVNIKIDNTTVSVMDFTSGLNWQARNLTLLPTHLEGMLIALPKVAKVAQEQVVEPKIQNPQPEELPLGETLKQLFEKPVLPEMTDVHLPLNLNIQEFRGAGLRLTGDTDLLVSSLLLKVSSMDGHVVLDALDVDSSQGLVNATGSANLRDKWPVDLTLNTQLNIDPVKGEKVKMKVGGELRGILKVGMNLSGPVDMELTAQTQLAEAGLPLNLEIVSKQLYWPFTGKKEYQADDLKLKFSGKMTDYALSFRTAVKGEQIPPAVITLDGKGNEQQLNVDKLRIAALQGNTDLKAVLDWSRAISWRGELKLEGINTAKQFPDWPAKLDGWVKTSGSLYGGTWQVKVPELKLAGNVKQNKVSMAGKLEGNSYMQWKIPGLHLELGRNSADVKGELGPKDLELDANIDAPNLDNALPGLGGTAKGTVKVRGDVKSPNCWRISPPMVCAGRRCPSHAYCSKGR